MEDFKFAFVKKMNAFQHGASIAANIPSEIAKLLQITVGDEVAFFVDEQHKVGLIVLAKEVALVTSFGESSLGFSVSAELLKKLLVRDQ